jgi:hypothetical protein
MGAAMSESAQHRLELWATILLSVATLLTAWSAFQATKWGGVMAIRFSEANAARTQSAGAAARAQSQRSLDVTVFTSWVEAVAAERAEQRRFVEDRFRDEFRPAFDAWVTTRPRFNPSAPPTPFAMPEYRLAEERRSAELSSLADRRGQQARDANQQGDDYVLLTVVFASVLFFSGIATKLTGRGPQIALLSFATALTLGALAVGVTFPIEV